MPSTDPLEQPPLSPEDPAAAEGTAEAEGVEDRDAEARWARLAQPDAGETPVPSRRRRSRVFRNNDRTRRPLRSTEEANAVAARRKEQITGTPAGSGPPAEEPPALSATEGFAEPAPTIRASRPAATGGDEAAGAEMPEGEQETPPDAAGIVETNGSGAAHPATSGNGATPAGAPGDGDDEDGATRRRGLLRRGRSRRKGGGA